ncbi:MAG: hypothetical protein AB1547_02525 [Thermodesulfobacteriota bacterium]
METADGLSDLIVNSRWEAEPSIEAIENYCDRRGYTTTCDTFLVTGLQEVTS